MRALAQLRRSRLVVAVFCMAWELLVLLSHNSRLETEAGDQRGLAGGALWACRCLTFCWILTQQRERHRLSGFFRGSGPIHRASSCGPHCLLRTSPSPTSQGV